MAANTSPKSALAIIIRADAETELAPHGKGNVYAPCVLAEGDLHRMWYGGQGRDGHDRIHYAESRDGKTWTKKGVVLDNGKANHVNDPSVVKTGDVYYMYYTLAERGVRDRVGVATSADGISWEPKGIALDVGEPGQWDALSAGRPSVIVEDETFKLWYDGRKDFPPGFPDKNVPTSNDSRRAVGYATSRDGLHFGRVSRTAVFEHDAGGVDVKRIDGRLILAYESRQGIRLARGEDETHWTDAGLLTRLSGEPSDASGQLTPCLVSDNPGKNLTVFFGAAEKASWDRNCIARLDATLP